MNKLSTLIREGAQKRPHQVRNMFIAPVDDGVYGTCAIGAALDAIGYDLLSKPEPGDLELYRLFHLQSIGAAHPLTDAVMSLWSLIIDLNDVHKWSREQIADWLASINL